MTKGKVISLLIILSLMIIPSSFFITSNAQTFTPIVFVAPIPYDSGFYQQGFVTITTNDGTTGTLDLFLFNPTFESESVTIYVNSSQYATVTLPPYQYVEEPVSLSLGLHNVLVNGQTLYVNVTESSYTTVTTYINGTPSIYKVNVIPGNTYIFDVSYSHYPNDTEIEASVFSDIGFYSPPNDQQGSTPYLSPDNTFLVQIPNGIPQGIYFAYVYTYFDNATNGKVLDYSFGIIILNVSYGLSTSILSSPSVLSENGVTVEMQNISGFTYLYLQYPFSFENTYSINVNGVSINAGNITIKNDVYPSLISTPQLMYYGSNYPIAFSNNGILIKLPQFGVGSIEISSPSGKVSVSIPPTIKLGKLNVNVISSNRVAIPNAKVTIYNSTTNAQILNGLTNSSGIATFTLPIGQEVKISVTAQGYYQNSTTITVSSSSFIKIYLTPVQIVITPITFKVNSSTITPQEISSNTYFINESIGSQFSLIFSVKLNMNVSPNITATINGTQVKITYEGNNEYALAYSFTSEGIYYLNINVSYNGATQNMMVKVNIYKPTVVTSTISSTTSTSSTTTTSTTSSTTTTTSSTTTTTSATTSSTTTTPTTTATIPPITQPTTTASSLPITDIAIVVVVIVIAAIAAVVILRR